MRIKKQAIIVTIICILASITLGFFMLAPMVSNKLKTVILAESKNTINGELTLSEVKLVWLNKVQLTNVQIQKDGSELLSVPKLNISLAPWNLLASNKLSVVESITIYSPTANLQMNDKKEWNISDLLKPSPESANKFVSLINLRDAKLHANLNGQMLDIIFNGSVDARSGDDNYALDLEADTKDVGMLKVVGLINVNRQGRMNISTKQLNLAPLKSILTDYVQMDQLDGSVSDIDIIWQDQNGKKLLNGKFEAKDVGIVYPYDDKKINLSITGPVTFKDSALNFKQTLVSVNGQVITVDGGVAGKNDSWLPDNLKLSIKQAELGKLLMMDGIQGKVDAEAILKNDNGELVFAGEIKSDKLVFKNQEFSNLRIPFNYAEKKLYIDDAQVNALNGRISAKAVYNFLEKRYNLDVDAQELNLGKLNIDELDGLAKAKLVASGNLDKDTKAFDLAGTLTLNEFNYQNMEFREVTADVLKFQDSIDISNGSAVLNTMGKVAFFGNLKQENLADFYLTASRVPLEFIAQQIGLKSTGNVNVGLRVLGDLDNPQLQAMINTTEPGSLAGVKFDNLTAFITERDKVVDIKDLHITTSKILETTDGSYRMSGTVDLQNSLPALNLDIETKNVRTDDFMRDNFDLDVTGYFNSRIHVGGSINSPEVVARAILHEGSIDKFPIHYLRAELTYKDGDLSIPNLVLDSLTGLKVRSSGTMHNNELNFDLVAKEVDLEDIPRVKGYGVKGVLNFDGKVHGALSRPQFVGFVDSKAVTVFGQEFIDIIGKISSDAWIKTEAMLDFKEAKGGEFYFNGGLDYSQHYAYGKFIVNKANIEPFLTISNENYGVKGLLDGEIYLNRNGKGSGTEIIGHLSEASIAELPIQEAEINVFIDREKFMINKFSAVQGAGTLNAYGQAYFHGNSNINIIGQNLSAQLLAVGRKKGAPITGLMNLNASVTGNTLKPDVNANINIVNGGIGDMNFDSLTGHVLVRENDRLEIEKMTVSKMGFTSTLSGTIPLALFKDQQNRAGLSQEMDLRLKAEDANLGVLAASSHINYSSGTFFGDLRITGTLEEPKIYGNLVVKNGVVKFDMFKNPLTDIALDLAFNGQYINLKEASAKMGKGTLNFGGNLNIAKEQTAAYNFWGKANNIDLESLYIKGLFSGEFNISPQPNRNRPLLTANTTLENITFMIPGIPDLGESGTINLGLNVDLKVGKNVRIVSKSMCDLYLKGGMKIRGLASYPIIDGTIEVDRGTITYLRTPFKIEQAALAYPVPGTYLPNVNMEATARLLQYDIKLQVRGPVTNMDVLLSSNPPRSQQELFRLLTLRIDSNSSEFTTEDAKGLLVTGLQMSVFGDVEYEVRSRLGLNEFRIYQGNINTGTALDMTGKQTVTSKDRETTYNVLVSKYLTDKLLFGYTTSVDFNNYMVYTQYFFNRNLNLSFGMDEIRKKKVALEYKVTF